tara:strand:- start:169 stop:996 length:828 start_codon:yes stop_codon:yes gene_type:complete
MSIAKINKASLTKKGYVVLRSFLGKKYSSDLFKKISKDRGKKFYKTKKEFLKKSRFRRYSPDLKFNYLNNFDVKEVDRKLLKLIPGKIISKKIIWNVNKKYLPRWLRKYSKFMKSSINPYIKKQFQDETHFFNGFIHQDILGNKKDNMITCTIYLDKVGKNRAPLTMYEQSHKLGVSNYESRNIFAYKFDHRYLYYNNGNTMFTKKKVITGNAGDLLVFDARCLHSTDENTSKSNRVALRYLIIPKMKLCKPVKKSAHFSFGFKGDHLQLMGKGL